MPAGRLSRPFAVLAIDPDVDLNDPQQRADVGRRELSVLAAVAAGGIVGAEARYGLALAVPHDTGTWPWATLIINVLGSLLMGVLMVVLLELITPHHLLRPFLGVGVLGGFTTFSTFSVDADDLLRADRPLVALGYVAASLAGCLAATALAMSATRSLAGRPPDGEQPAEHPAAAEDEAVEDDAVEDDAADHEAADYEAAGAPE